MQATDELLDFPLHMSEKIKTEGSAIVFRWDMSMGVLSTKNRSTRLIATSDSIVLDGPLGKHYELSVDKIDRIEKGKFHLWFLTGSVFGSISIYHTIDDYPEILMFTGYFKKTQSILTVLKSLGYNVIV